MVFGTHRGATSAGAQPALNNLHWSGSIFIEGPAASGAKRTFVETLIPAGCQEETLAAQASGILDLSSCRRGCRAADRNRTVRDERDAGGGEGVSRSRAGRRDCFGER